MRLDWQKIGLLVAGAFAGVVVFAFKTKILAPDANLANLVGTIFSILAGLLAVALNLVVVSKPTAFKSKLSQRRYLEVMGRRLRRHNWLFYCYFLVLIFVFYSELFQKTWPLGSKFFESLYLSLAAASLIWSFSIPTTITQIQNENARLADKVSEKK